MAKPRVGIIMGSDSDLGVMQEAAAVCDSFGIPYELTIVSAHRTPERLYSYAKAAHTRGLRVIIAGAGGAAHLPGMVASLTTLPVVGVPIKGKNLEGLDSLLSIVQMPPGIPVATVAINAAKNAGLLAVKIFALSDTLLHKKLTAEMLRVGSEVKDKAKKLERVGYKKYLSDYGHTK